MTRKKRRPPWRAAFLRALARWGNVRAAAEAAGVDKGTAYDHRRRDEKFAAKWELARQKARAAGPLHRPSGGPPPRAGEDFVLRHSKHCGTQMVRAGPGRWSQRSETVYLANLRTTGCLGRAAAAAGFSRTAVDYRRKRYPAFGAQCDAALEEATAQLRSFVVAAGIAAFDPLPEALPEGVEVPKVTVAEAIAILRLKGPSTSLGTSGIGPQLPEEPDVEAVREEILRRLDAMEAHEGRMGQERAASPLHRPSDGDEQVPMSPGHRQPCRGHGVPAHPRTGEDL